MSNNINWIHCSRCLNDTKHTVVYMPEPFQYFEKIKEDDVEFCVDRLIGYEVIECNGCGYVTLKMQEKSEFLNSDTTKYYPPPVLRRPIPWRKKLPKDMGLLLDEIFLALDNNLRRLTMMGVRAIVDLYMSEKVGNEGSFQERLNKIVDAEFLTTKDREGLEAVLEAGHAASHRAHNPSNEDLEVALDIIERLLHPLVHDHEERVERLRMHTPGRTKVKKSKKVKKDFEIVFPKDSEIAKEWIQVSGVGAPPNHAILLFTWLENKYLSLQDEIVMSDVNGEWHEQKCHLLKINWYRKLYAVAVPPEHFKEVKALSKKIGLRINPEEFHRKLEKEGIANVLSAGKELIRIR